MIDDNNSNKNNETVSLIEPEPRPTSPTLIDTSTVINETHAENSKKSDGSSIQINLNSRHESDEKFKSLVLTMTALRDEQKVNLF